MFGLQYLLKGESQRGSVKSSCEMGEEASVIGSREGRGSLIVVESFRGKLVFIQETKSKDKY